MALGMVDGLSRSGRGPVLVQNSPGVHLRVVSVDLNGDGIAAERLQILAPGLPEGLIPSTSAVAGEPVLLVAAAPFDPLDGGEAPPHPAVVRVPFSP